MRRLAFIAVLCAVATSAFSQTPPVAAVPPTAPGPPVYNVPLTDKMIDTIIAIGGICLQAKAYDCEAAISMRDMLNEARKPKPKAP